MDKIIQTEQAHFCDSGIRHNDVPCQHVHEDLHELCVTLAGRGTQHSGERTMEMETGSVFFFPAGQIHISDAAAGTAGLLGVVYFSPSYFKIERPSEREGFETFRLLGQAALAGGNKLELSAAAEAEAARLYRRGREEEETRRKGWQMAVRSVMANLALLLLRDLSLPVEAGDGGADPRIVKAVLYLENNFAANPAVDRLAEVGGLSRSRFHALFKRETGQCMKDYANKLKCAAAAELLLRTALSLEVVAERTGFNSMGCFFSVFKLSLGTTPQKFRAAGQAAAARGATR